MINKFEAVGIGVSVGAMALALFLLQLDSVIFSNDPEADNQLGSVIVADGKDLAGTLGTALEEATSATGDLERMIIDDIALGIGSEVKVGDKVTVNYIGTLQNGQQFDNSYNKGTPFSFVVGEKKVIKGWEEGIVGMKVGGQRILVIPSALGYGEGGFGPIPGNATLVFSIELLSIN